MKTAYYIIGIAPIIWEILSIMNLHEVHAFCREYELVSKSKKPLNSTQNTFTFLMMLYVIWAIIGLFTSQWPLFILLLLVSFIPKKHVMVRLLDATISVSILIFIILNRFHFHINIWDWFKHAI